MKEQHPPFKVVKYWDTYPSNTWKNNIQTYEEAKKVVEDNNYNIKIVKVNTFKEAVEYLTK